MYVDPRSLRLSCSRVNYINLCSDVCVPGLWLIFCNLFNSTGIYTPLKDINSQNRHFYYLKITSKRLSYLFLDYLLRELSSTL